MYLSSNKICDIDNSLIKMIFMICICYFINYIYFNILFAFIIKCLITIKGYNSKKGVHITISETKWVYITISTNLKGVDSLFPTFF